MTYAPADLLAVQRYLHEKTGLPWVSLGIVGDASHAGGYHCGSSGTVSGDYSVTESSRDWNGLTDAASALDVGEFDVTVAGRAMNLRVFSLALVNACASGDPRARDIREVIYTPDGVNVRRWDRLGVRSGGDDSHLTHTHISFFRDSEGRRSGTDNFLGLVRSTLEGTVALDQNDVYRVGQQACADTMGALFNRQNSSGFTNITLGAPLQAKMDAFVAAVSQLPSVSTRLDSVNSTVASVNTGVTALLGRPPLTLSDAQVAALADRVAASLETAIGAIVEAKIRRVLGEVDGATPAG